jgi:hypothetical protein
LQLAQLQLGMIDELDLNQSATLAAASNSVE